jgi:hypothetical protein
VEAVKRQGGMRRKFWWRVAKWRALFKGGAKMDFTSAVSTGLIEATEIRRLNDRFKMLCTVVSPVNELLPHFVQPPFLHLLISPSTVTGMTLGPVPTASCGGNDAVSILIQGTFESKRPTSRWLRNPRVRPKVSSQAACSSHHVATISPRSLPLHGSLACREPLCCLVRWQHHYPVAAPKPRL